MRRTSTTTPASEAGARAGFSLLEMLIVLALMGLTALIVFPRGERLMDQIVAHAVFFDFQRQVADLRGQAYRRQSPITLYPSASAGAGDPQGRAIDLRAGWSYRLDQPVMIDAGGVCSSAHAQILHLGRPVMTLVAAPGDCKFNRLS